MNPDRGLVDFVCGSIVRTTVLGALADEPRGTDALLGAVDASESAVYDAVAALEREGLVRQADREAWEPTGTGIAVHAVMQVRDDVEALIETDPSYWHHHDLAVLPDPFRTRVQELVGAEVVRATDTDPNRVVRMVGEGIERAEDLLIIAPVYHERYETALKEVVAHVDPRIIVDKRTVRDRLSGELTDEPPGFEVEARVTDIDIALGVTHDTLFLSLPTLDGSYDARAEVVARTDDALRWGRQLFEHCWNRATPAEEFLNDQPDLALE